MSEARAILVGAGEPRYVAELGRLAATLGMKVVGVIEQGRRDGAGCLGRGKRKELGELVRREEATFVVSDDELTASPARVLEHGAGVFGAATTGATTRLLRAP